MERSRLRNRLETGGVRSGDAPHRPDIANDITCGCDYRAGSDARPPLEEEGARKRRIRLRRNRVLVSTDIDVSVAGVLEDASF